MIHEIVFDMSLGMIEYILHLPIVSLVYFFSFPLQPMPKIEQNGQGFKYILTWRRFDIPDAEDETEPIDDPLAWHFVVPTKYDKPYIPFEITVKSDNSVGPCTVSPKKIIGHSGEDGEIYQNLCDNNYIV